MMQTKGHSVPCELTAPKLRVSGAHRITGGSCQLVLLIDSMKSLLLSTLIAFALLGNCHAEVADGFLVRWVEQRTSQMKFEPGPFETIGWATDLQHAFEIAKEHDRPIFLFTLDGHMNNGRC